MLDVSRGETFVLIGLSISFVGRKDLPKASKFLDMESRGKTGWDTSGARARADAFAQNNELHALQNELRSGLRELDTVKGELAVAASSRGLIGRNLASGTNSMTNSMNSTMTATMRSTVVPLSSLSSSPFSSTGSAAATATATTSPTNPISNNSINNDNNNNQYNQPYTINLAPRSHSVAAVAEEEWEKQGIGFKSRAEQGTGYWFRSPTGASATSTTTGTATTTAATGGIGGGSNLLADFLQQNLIHDQYDRAVMEQDLQIREKMRQAQQKKRDGV
eukprot:CAMPEP_0176496830 /NCGR_PEP_ID=MMETSP0200_2-20121128/11399_1 /TAXON_ID=947934 /ORGANISM="Chaetoceros sp., Strain GSL56" /LENGTH=276 /DNA_ID=CAMNT_0017894801 /DNA_START=98 /DNA_END=929 /DNA_ORIENTATION=-